MGYGPIINGKQTPITPYKGSWAGQMEQQRKEAAPNRKATNNQWPMGYPIRSTNPIP